MFNLGEAIVAAIDKFLKERKFLLKQLLQDQGRFSSSDDDQ